MNGINSIRLDINTVKYNSSAGAQKKVIPLTELKSSTEADRKKPFKIELNNEFDSSKDQSNNRSELLFSDRKYYRANLLNEIVNKMSGLEQRTKPGHYVEYYA